MKATYKLMLLSLCAGLFSCTSEIETDEALEVGGATIKNITVTLPEIQGSEEFATTRTQFVMDANGVKAHWAEGDVLGIFPAKGDQVSFPITSGTETNTAKFDGGDWGLKAGRSYAAYYPFDRWNFFRDNESVLMDYTGQLQNGNDNFDHLGAYDFLAAGQVNPNSAGYLSLEMDRLGSIVMLKLTLPVACTPTDIELTSDKNSFITKANLAISTSSPVISVLEESSTFTLELENVALTSDNQVLTAYMMLSPVAFKTGGSTWSVRVNTADGRYYLGEIETKDLEANKPYMFTSTLEPGFAMLTNANLIAAAEESAGQQFTKNADGTVTLDDANMAIVEAVTELALSHKNDPSICDEIEYFVNLRALLCDNNQLTSLDVSHNTALLGLYCFNNQLTSLDLSNNPSLEDLNCSDNPLTSLDVSHNTALQFLTCFNNQLTSLDLSNNIALQDLDCHNNQLTNLDLSNNIALQSLDCPNNQLTNLDLSNNIALQSLDCQNNQLTNLDLSNNIALQSLSCFYNQLNSLDLSRCSALEDLNCSDNPLTSLDVSSNTALIYLCCSDNQLTSLDLSNNIALQNLTCYMNQLNSLNLSRCSALEALDCRDNQLTSLDLSSNAVLGSLRCFNNKLSALDISDNTELELNYVAAGNQPGELVLYVNGTQSGQELPDYYNENVKITLKEDGGATQPDPGGWN